MTMRDRQARRQAGSALFVALMMLVIMGFLGVAALDTVTRDRQVAGFQNRNKSAFYAAEAGVAEARSEVREVQSRTDNVDFLFTPGAPRLLGDAALYDREVNLPRFYGDPDFAPAVQYLEGDGPVPDGFNYGGSGKTIVETFWQINVVGESADGSRVPVEVVEVKALGGSPQHRNSY